MTRCCVRYLPNLKDVSMTDFSALRQTAGLEILEMADHFDVKYDDVAKWEVGTEPAPEPIIHALGQLVKFPVVKQAIKTDVVDTLFQGDCLRVMDNIPDASVDLILCDLPYGTTQNKWDSIIDLPKLWEQYRRVIKPSGAIVLTAQGIFTAKLMLSNEEWFKYKIVWEKSKSTNFLNAKKQPLRKHEDICVFYKSPPTYNPQMRAGLPYDKGTRKDQLSGSYGDFLPVHVKSDGERYPSDVVYFKTAESERERTVWHPTQKPVELGRYLVRTFTNKGDVVLDNAFGSGSFLVAAAMEDRRFIGIERNEEVHLFKDERIDYVKVAQDRLYALGKTAHVRK